MLQDKISFFLKKNEIYRKPLEKIINNMLEKCRYINGESLERHNWKFKSSKLEDIPENLDSPTYEDELLLSLEKNENESIDSSIIELLWGDIQLGKRVHACIIMWISVYILKRPVLIIFRNLNIDIQQLYNDIIGTENYNFNSQFIKKIFDDFKDELLKEFGEEIKDCYKDYKLPELKNIRNDDILNKLGRGETMNPTDIFCCLMNKTQLDKINNKFSENIYYTKELVNITLLIDESDLMSPTSSNDKSSSKDFHETTECEKYLAKIYKKVNYVLHITGTAHSLLYNVTTTLKDYITDEENENMTIQLKISKVHKMKRSDDYYGLFNNCIKFKSRDIKIWWNEISEGDNLKNKYNIIEDYQRNIKNIIKKIIKRESQYNSFLISEEKIKKNQFNLVYNIICDFINIFVIIFHGNCLRLYFNKNFLIEIKQCSKWDSEKSCHPRLYQDGGIYGSPYFKDEFDQDLPNDYCYFDINNKNLNIKFVYKLLSILFTKSEIQNINKTVITISGKYSERGYSFTSDDYDIFSFHLTDQYLVCHSSYNCTDISQRLRLQGKYNDINLKNGNTKLILWTSSELKKVLTKFYIEFIKKIEKFIMNCNKWEEIKDLIESIIDTGNLRFKKYMKYIDTSKKRKNIKIQKAYNKIINGYRLFSINDDDTELKIKKLCSDNKLPDYNECINEIKSVLITDYAYNKIKIAGVPIFIKLTNICDIILNFKNKKLNENNITKFYDLIKNDLPEEFIKENYRLINKRMVFKYDSKYEVLNIKNHIKNNTIKEPDSNCQNNMDFSLLIICEDIVEFDCKKGDCFITYYTNKNQLIYNKNININPIDTNDNIFITENNVVKYSVIKEKFNLINSENLPDYYYWKSPDDWLYLFIKSKPSFLKIKIK